MLKKWLLPLVLITILTFAIAGCENRDTQTAAEDSPTLLEAALDIVHALSQKDMTLLAKHSHPNAAIRFTPYGYVDFETDLAFSAETLKTLYTDSTLYTWGAYDGTGDPIVLTFKDYFEAFVYDANYLEPHLIGVNTVVGTGNSINNAKDAYPNASFVEFHFKGFEAEFVGLDWSSLILVLEKVEGEWKLIGIIHNQWTI